MSEIEELENEERDLLDVALECMKNAHVIWGFEVGAAVLAEDNKLYQGCNVESKISGLGICAERCAIDHAVLHGNKKIKKIGILIDAKKAKKPAPCGACLQYIYDFSDGEVTVIMGKVKEWKILPKSIEEKQLKKCCPIVLNLKKDCLKSLESFRPKWIANDFHWIRTQMPHQN